MAKQMSVSVDAKEMLRAFRKMSKEDFPEAVAGTLNRVANAVTVQQIRNVKSEFTVRTKYTINSMTSSYAKPFKALNKARGKNVRLMFSRSGTFSKYLWMQENDTVRRLESGGPLPIATDEARMSKSQKKAIKRVYRLTGEENLRKGAFDLDGTFRFFIGEPRGIFRGKERRYGLYERRNKNKKLVMLRNLESESAHIKGQHFHQKAVDKSGNEKTISAAFGHEMKKMGY